MPPGSPRDVPRSANGAAHPPTAPIARTCRAPVAATRYRSLQPLFGWLDEDGEIDGSPMAKMYAPKIPAKPVPCLPMRMCGAYQMIKDRGPRLGPPDLHPHQLRHTSSHDWRTADLRATRCGSRDGNREPCDAVRGKRRS